MAENRNPFIANNFLTGGGAWDQQIVTITRSRTIIDKLPFNDAQTGEPVVKNVMEWRGIADTEEVERRETYSTGQLLPSDDGLGLRHPQGKEVLFHHNSEIARLAGLIAEGGFDVSRLYKSGKLDVSAFEGARFLMKGEQRLDKEGNPKKNKQGRDAYPKFWPVKFEGFREGVAVPVGGPSPELKAKAVLVVSALLDENGGKLSRADTVRKISAKLAKDPDVNKIIALISREEFHKDVPWVRDGTTYTKV